MESKAEKILPYLYISEEHIFADVLPRLPAKSLLRFKNVCKKWANLVESPPFAAAHLRHRSTRSQQSVIATRFDLLGLPKSERLPDGTLPAYGVSLLNDDGILDYLPLEKIRKQQQLQMLFNFNVVGSCNGLILFYHENYCDHSSVLWNPVTRQRRHIPTSRPSDLHLYNIVALGFGFDPEINDYKLLRIWEHMAAHTKVISDDEEAASDNDAAANDDDEAASDDGEKDNDDDDDIVVNDENRLKAEVITLGSGCRKRIEKVPPFNKGGNLYNFVTVNGVWYHMEEENTVLSFDFRDEVFGKIELPYDDSEEEFIKRLIEYNGSLAMAMVESRSSPNRHFNIWTYQNDCWFHILTIGPFMTSDAILGTWRNTHFIIKRESDSSDNENNLYLYDSLTKNLEKILTNCRAKRFWRAINYEESLVSVDAPPFKRVGSQGAASSVKFVPLKIIEEETQKLN